MVLAEFKEQAAKTGSTSVHDHYKEVTSYGSPRSEYWRVQAYRQAVARCGFLKRVSTAANSAWDIGAWKHVLLKGAELRAEFAKRAAEYADAALEGFIAKMTRKLNAMGDLVTVAFGGSLGTNRISLTYANATMSVTNSVVIKSSSRGVLFNQFPTTFHDVVIDGVRLKVPSEAKVKKAMAELVTGKKIEDVLLYRVVARSRFYPQARRTIFKSGDKAEAEAQLASALADKRRFTEAFIKTEVMNVEAK